MARHEEIRALNEIVVRSQSDGELRRKLLADPRSVLKHAGISFLDAAAIQVVENGDRKVHIVVPHPTSFDGLSPEFLREFALYEVMRRTRDDAAFRERLVTQTQDALAECGIHVPAGVELRVLINDERVVHLALPAVAGELREADLDSVHGGAGSPEASQLQARTIAWGGPTGPGVSPADWVGSFI